MTLSRAASSFGPFSGLAPPITMVEPTDHPSLMPPLAKYRDYFARSETDTFCGHYVAILRPYSINTKNVAAATAPAEVAQQIYTAAQEVILTVFLQWHRSMHRGGHILRCCTWC